MLGKRSRPIQRTQNESHSFMKEKNPKSGFFNAPRIFIGFALKYPAEAAGDGSRSPTSPLECRRCFETVDSRSKTNAAVGLGILAALQAESAETAKSNVVSPKNSIARLFFKEIRQVTEKSQPIPIKRQVVKEEENVDDESELEFSESYTCVTTHGSKSVTKHVYIDNREIEVVASSKASKATVFEASSFTDESSLPVADFLSACFLCGRPLCAGKDIYMYRGDRAFCSVECRYQQIVSDEKKERNCSSVMKRSFMSASPQKRGSCYQRQPKALFTVAAA